MVQLSEPDQCQSRARGGARPPVPATAAGARRNQLADYQPAALRGGRHASVRTLGRHASASQRRLARRPCARSAAARSDLGHGAEQQPDLPRPRDQQQHAGAELGVSCRDVLRHRHARVQSRLQPDARVPRGIPVRDESGELSIQYGRRGDDAEPDHHEEPAVHGKVEHGQRSRHLRPGPLDHGSDYAESGAALRRAPDQFPRADGRSGAARAEPEHYVPRAEQPELERHHLPDRSGLRPRWEWQDRVEGGVQQVSAWSDAERHRPQSEPGASDDRAGQPLVDRWQPRLRSAVRSAESAAEWLWPGRVRADLGSLVRHGAPRRVV